MSTASHLAKLNGPQRRAVTHGEPLPDKGFKSGPLLIVAGAGTGKTDTLAHRVAHLVIHGVDPARIMMLTFTRRAATEMRRRAHELAKAALNETLGGVSQSILQRMSWAGTFHSVGNRLLRHYARHLKLDPQFSVLDRGDSADLMDSLAPGARPRAEGAALSRARTPACRSTPTASTPSGRSRRRSRASFPGARSGNRT